MYLVGYINKRAKKFEMFDCYNRFNEAKEFRDKLNAKSDTDDGIIVKEVSEEE